jgi:membrane-associated phospholipid phosphatase
MEVVIWFQGLEPRALFRLVFSAISWCGDGPLYVLLFPLLYWLKSPPVAVRYGYLFGFSVLVTIVMKTQMATVRPFLVAPEQVAFLHYPLEGFYWFSNPETLINAYRQSPAFPSGHALLSAALGMYLLAHTISWRRRGVLVFFMVTIPLARLYLGVHYPIDILAGSGVGLLLFALAINVRWEVIASRLAHWGLQWWHRYLFVVIPLTGGLAVLAKAAFFVWLVLLTYPLLLRGAQRPMQHFAAPRSAAWHTYNAVWGCLGTGILLVAAAPLLSLGALVSVPLVTGWVTLGCPFLVQRLYPLLRIEY